jgi:RNA polymerase-binding transcription factor DksA
MTMNLLAKPHLSTRRTPSAQRLLQQRNRLLRARAVLRRQIKRLTEDASEDIPEYSIHMADAGTDSFDRDLALGLASLEQERLYEVDEALKRIQDGTYGFCELTGRPIPWKRLEAVPWTRFSIDAETELEAGVHPHIGPLRTVRLVSEERAEAAGLDNLSVGSREESASEELFTSGRRIL